MFGSVGRAYTRHLVLGGLVVTSSAMLESTTTVCFFLLLGFCPLASGTHITAEVLQTRGVD